MKTFQKFISFILLAVLFGSLFSFAIGFSPIVAIVIVAAFSLMLEFTGVGAPNVFGIAITASFSGPDGSNDNIGGTSGIIYIAATNTFTSTGITEPPSYATAATMAELAENDTAFTFATGGRWWEVYTTENTGKLMLKEQGDMDGKSYKPEGEIFYPGDTLAMMGMLRWMKNQKFIILVPTPGGVVHQVGTKAFPASLIGEWESATNAQGVKGSKIKFTTAVVSGPMIYTEAISLTPAP